MERNIVILSVLILMLAVYSVSAYAETVQGEVKDIYDSNKVKVLKKDPATGKIGTEQLQIQVYKETKLMNFATLTELRNGDEVKAEAVQNKTTGNWDAQTLSVSKVKIQ